MEGVTDIIQSSELVPQDPVKLGMVAHSAVVVLGR